MKAERRKSGDQHSEEVRDAFRSKSCIIEKPALPNPDLDRLRKMILRDEIDSLVKMTCNPEYQALIAKLLTDQFLGIGPTAADVLRLAANEGISIDASIPALKASLENKYSKINSAAALATHYRMCEDQQGMNELLSHEDKEIRMAVIIVVTNMWDEFIENKA